MLFERTVEEVITRFLTQISYYGVVSFGDFEAELM
jgi:hypothetical protein